MQQDERKEAQQHMQRQPYTSPRLEVLGSVRELTAGGSGGPTEFNGQQCRTNKFQRC